MSDRRVRAGAIVLGAWALVAALAPVLPLRDPNAQPDGLVLRSLPPMSRVAALRSPDGSLRYAAEVADEPGGGLRFRRGASWTTVPASERVEVLHPRFVLGTDALGRDLLARLIWGARVSLLAGALAALVAIALGGAVGAIAGLAGGSLDALLMRATDAALSIPRLFLLLLLAALFRPSLATTVVLVGGTTWMVAARLVRAETLSLKTRDHLAAARSSGASPLRVATRHLLPHLAAILGIEGSLRLGQAVLLEASLSFLGLGVPPPSASWGGLIADGRDRLLDAWWIATWPGIALATVVVAAGLVAEGAEDRL
ncbi:MAG TPA: ABC transporter permease [Candidatus Polarisedimenticolaceae bacterium]|nr:ABC transporter permease [Candidatus Polarisedimenticolaceae bacterium]